MAHSQTHIEHVIVHFTRNSFPVLASIVDLYCYGHSMWSMYWTTSSPAGCPSHAMAIGLFPLLIASVKGTRRLETKGSKASWTRKATNTTT
eukprot:6177733-Pleurochrysis_carterae.AAC.1